MKNVCNKSAQKTLGSLQFASSQYNNPGFIDVINQVQMHIHYMYRVGETMKRYKLMWLKGVEQ